MSSVPLASLPFLYQHAQAIAHDMKIVPRLTWCSCHCSRSRYLLLLALGGCSNSLFRILVGLLPLHGRCFPGCRVFLVQELSAQAVLAAKLREDFFVSECTNVQRLHHAYHCSGSPAFCVCASLSRAERRLSKEGVQIAVPPKIG